jgi:hypothetical protein
MGGALIGGSLAGAAMVIAGLMVTVSAESSVCQVQRGSDMSTDIGRKDSPRSSDTVVGAPAKESPEKAYAFWTEERLDEATPQEATVAENYIEKPCD